MKDPTNRRQFLKNTSLAALTLSVLSNSLEAKTPPQSQNCPTTTRDFYGEGPFYTDGPPEMTNNKLADDTEVGQRIIISGRIYNLDCTEFIPNTLVDVWHADDAGAYDNDGYKLRGVTHSNAQGFYMFETIQPGKYLNGATFRPSHIHFKIKAPDSDLLITQLYFEGDTSIPGDAAASNTSDAFDATNRIIPLTANADGILEGVWDIRIDGEGIGTGLNDLHLDKGMIYSAGPNPYSDQITIRYGVFRDANTNLQVFNLNGQLVATLEERQLNAEKYEAVWHPDAGLPSGHYFITLKINDLQVHYLKVLKQ